MDRPDDENGKNKKTKEKKRETQEKDKATYV